MAFINIPNEITKKDIKFYDKIHKKNSYGYIISDLKNIDLKNTEYINSTSLYDYIFDVLDTYIFIVGNANNKREKINLNKIDFMSEIMKFELDIYNNRKTIKKIDISSNVLTIISKDLWLKDEILDTKYKKLINLIIDKSKIHLQDINSDYEKLLNYICDNSENCMGTFRYGLSKLITENYVLIQKNKNINGYIIKTDFSKF